MARSTYVYIVIANRKLIVAENLSPEELDNLREKVEDGKPHGCPERLLESEIKASFTVKYEMINWLKEQKNPKQLEIWRTAGNTDVKEVTETIMEELQKELEACPNCKEPMNDECACFRNRCVDCGKAVGNITFSKCDKCF